MENVKPRTIQADDQTWEAFKDIAWSRRLSASKLFREWVIANKPKDTASAGTGKGGAP